MYNELIKVERSKQCFGIASRSCLMVNGGCSLGARFTRGTSD